MALTNLETYYSFPNIDDSNNIIKISIDGKKTWKTIRIEMGCYSVKAINALIQKELALDKKNSPLVFEANSNTLKFWRLQMRSTLLILVVTTVYAPC